MTLHEVHTISIQVSHEILICKTKEIKDYFFTHYIRIASVKVEKDRLKGFRCGLLDGHSTSNLLLHSSIEHRLEVITSIHEDTRMSMNTCLSNDKSDVEIQGGGVQAQVPHVNIKLDNSTWLIQSSNGGGETFGVREDAETLHIDFRHENISIPIQREGEYYSKEWRVDMTSI
jgi:hypothetical protein